MLLLSATRVIAEIKMFYFRFSQNATAIKLYEFALFQYSWILAWKNEKWIKDCLNWIIHGWENTILFSFCKKFIITISNLQIWSSKYFFNHWKHHLVKNKVTARPPLYNSFNFKLRPILTEIHQN